MSHTAPRFSAEIRYDPPMDFQLDDERALLLSLQQGDRTAAERLVEATYGGVYAALVRLCGGNGDLAADLTQDSYQKAWQSIDRFDGRSKLSTWLYRIAYTTFLNHIRKPDHATSLEALTTEPAHPGRSAEETLSAAEEASLLREAVLELPEDLRFTLTAHYWAGLSVTEIASLETVTTVAIRKRLNRAYSLLESRIPRNSS